MIRVKEFDQTTLEVMSWGILKSIEKEQFLSKEFEVTAPDGTMLQGILEEQNCSRTWVLMISPYNDIGVSIVVFANRFISTIYVLNGRKVMTCILKKLKKKKI